jgi:O-antigen/teichoic acid export membrane protein
MESPRIALGSRTAVGSILLVGSRLATRVIDLGTMLILARLLEPKDFGLVAIAMSPVSIVEAALDMPVNQALLRLPEISKAHYDTVFTLALLRGLVLSCILLLVAWPIAYTYKDPRLTPLICFLALSPLMRGLVNQQLAAFQKRLSFWRDIAVEVSGKLFAFAFAVGLAVTTGSYWSIAAGTVSFAGAMTITSYFLAPFRLRLSLSELSDFSSFIGWGSASQIISACNWQFERLLVGKLKSDTQLGMFTASSDLSYILLQALFGPIIRPLGAAFSHLLDDRAALARSYQMALKASVSLGLPVVVGQSLLAAPIVHLILGDRWAGTAPLVRWFSLSLIPATFTVPAFPFLLSVGANKMFAQRSAIEFLVKIPLILVGTIYFGLFGLIGARCISESTAGIYTMMTVKKFSGLTLTQQVLGQWQSYVSTFVMAIGVLLWERQLDASIFKTQTVIYLISSGIVGASIYYCVFWALWWASGRPDGLETMVMRTLSSALGRLPRFRRSR